MSQTPESMDIELQTQNERTVGQQHEMTPPSSTREDYRGAGRLAGTKALVTGGDSGIGRAVALQLVGSGVRVNEVDPGPIHTPIQAVAFDADQVPQ